MKTRQQRIAFEVTAGTYELASGGALADLNALKFSIDDPGELGAARKKVLQPLVDLTSRVAGREDLHGKVWRSGKKPPFVGPEAKRDHSGA